MHYKLNTQIMDLVMAEARRLNVSPFKLINNIILAHFGVKEEGKKNERRTK